MDKKYVEIVLECNAEGVVIKEYEREIIKETDTAFYMKEYGVFVETSVRKELLEKISKNTTFSFTITFEYMFIEGLCKHSRSDIHEMLKEALQNELTIREQQNYQWSKYVKDEEIPVRKEVEKEWLGK